MGMIEADPATTATRQEARRVVAVLAWAAAGVGAATIPGHPNGINIVLVAVVASAAIAVSVGRDLDASDVGLGILALALVAPFAVLTAPWILALDAACALGVAAIAMARVRGWRDAVRAAFLLPARTPSGFLHATAPATRTLGAATRGRLPSWRSLVLSVTLVLLFGALFVSADVAFARLMNDAVTPDWDLTLIPARIAVGAVILALIGAFVLLRPTPEETAFAPDHLMPRPLRRSEWLLALSVLNVLFISFVAIQFTVLFGGRTQILTTAGLTYAEYARRGFFQLVAVALLVLGVLAAASAWSEIREPRDRRILQGLQLLLCGLTLVVLASALKRLALYEDVYGLTRLRLFVYFSIALIAGAIIAAIVAVALWRSQWMPRALALMVAVALLSLNALNPDAFIARRNVDRFLETGRIDRSYLAVMSPDAVGEIMRLPRDVRDCALAHIDERTSRDASILAWNLSRRRALPVLDESNALQSAQNCSP